MNLLLKPKIVQQKSKSEVFDLSKSENWRQNIIDQTEYEDWRVKIIEEHKSTSKDVNITLDASRTTRLKLNSQNNKTRDLIQK